MCAEPVRGWQFQAVAQDWRVLSTSGACAWFHAPSHRDGAALIRRIAELTGAATGGRRPNIDLRASGVQLRIRDDAGLTTADIAVAQGISAAARELGLTADPSVPQDLEWSIDTMNQPNVKPFWQTLLGYQDSEWDDLLDPLRRDPRVWFYAAEPRPLRNRIHFDVSVPTEVAEQRAAALKALGGANHYAPADGHALVTDAEGNEVDLVPAGGLDSEPEASDWWLPFGGMVFYSTGELTTAAELAEGVGAVADEIGLPLMVDIRGEGVMIDTGKDQWEAPRFAETARRVQAVARGLGLSADPSRPRFFQACIDAVDIPAVRRFWLAALGYRTDPREFVTDIYDPRRLNRPMIFQQMDPTDDARRRQRNRIHLDLYLPDDQVEQRIEAALAAGGRLTGQGAATVADPEGNEVDITKAIGDPSPAELAQFRT